jgi:hypothetical protein
MLFVAELFEQDDLINNENTIVEKLPIDQASNVLPQSEENAQSTQKRDKFSKSRR